MKIEQKPQFQRTYKKLHANQQADVDKVIRVVVDNPEIGKTKIGNLAGIQVYKFKMNKQLVPLAYSYEATSLTLTLLALGSHENFYRDLKSSGI